MDDGDHAWGDGHYNIISLKFDTFTFKGGVQKSWLAFIKKKWKQAGAELSQAQVKLEVIVEVGVEDRCIYLIPSEF